MEEYFAVMPDDKLATQLGAILEVSLVESGAIENDLTHNQGNVGHVLGLLLDGSLTSDPDPTLTSTRTLIGREVCLAEFMQRIIDGQAGDIDG